MLSSQSTSLPISAEVLVKSQRSRESRKYKTLESTDNYGAPGEIRTPDLVVRSHALYPTELRARIDTAGKTSLACGLTCSTGAKILHRYVI